MVNEKLKSTPLDHAPKAEADDDDDADDAGDDRKLWPAGLGRRKRMRNCGAGKVSEWMKFC